jgi:hypothetical protein
MLSEAEASLPLRWITIQRSGRDASASLSMTALFFYFNQPIHQPTKKAAPEEAAFLSVISGL